jgi:hypothetical protein
MTDDDLKTRIEALEARLDQVEQDSVDNRLEQFRGRIDDLKIQSALAKLDARDEVKAALDALDHAWREVRNRVEHAAAEARTGTGSARTTMTASARSAFGDLRGALDKAVESLRGQRD